jgi:hypothetical protein
MMNQQWLFQATLQYQPNVPPVEVGERSTRCGDLLGSGDGIVRGETLQGRVHWTIFEVQGPICETNIVGVITTDDGAEVAFETRGYGVVPDPTLAHVWEMPAVVTFRTESPAYQWLNTTLARLEGTFDMHSGVHTYQVYSPQRTDAGRQVTG